jgi:hypothetical protein
MCRRDWDDDRPVAILTKREARSARDQVERGRVPFVAAISLKFTDNIVRVGLNYQFH